MGSIIKSVSLTFEEDAFLKDFILSPTQLLKEKIWEMKGMLTRTFQKRIDKQASTIQFLNSELLRLQEKNEFLEKETDNATEFG